MMASTQEGTMASTLGGRKLSALIPDPLAREHKEARGANPMRPGQTFPKASPLLSK